MTRGKRPRECQRPNHRTITFYMQPVKKRRVSLPPERMAAVDPSQPTCLPTPSSLPPPCISPSPRPSSSIPPSPAPPSVPPSHASPLTLHSSPSLHTDCATMDDLENLLLLRGIPFQLETDGPTEEVQLFTRSQTSIADCLLKQRDYSGLTCDRLNRLLQYLQVSMSATRMPSADILSRLWHITSDLKTVVQHLDGETLMSVTSLLQSLICLHPPGHSHTAREQYHQFMQRLGRGGESGRRGGGGGGESGRRGGGGEGGVMFAAWLHIKQLLSAPSFTYFHRHLSFIVDLLLSDYHSHMTQSQPGSPIFVSVFWESSSGTNISFAVRQLLEVALQQLLSYGGSEVEYSVLQSIMALIFLVTTRSPDVILELVQMAQKLTKDSFPLFLSLLHPLSFHAQIITLRFTHIPASPRSLPRNSLPNLDKLNITSPPRSPTPPLFADHPPTRNNPRRHMPSTSPPAPLSPALLASCPTPPGTGKSSAPGWGPLLHPQIPACGSTPFKLQNAKSLSLSKSAGVKKVVHREVKKRPVSLCHTPTPKKTRLSCENCDSGINVHVCHRCRVAAVHVCTE